MESVSRIFLIVLLSVSAASAVQFSVQKSCDRLKVLAGRCEGTMERGVGFAEQAIEHSGAHSRPAGRELDRVASRVRLQRGGGAVAETMENLWVAYGH